MRVYLDPNTHTAYVQVDFSEDVVQVQRPTEDGYDVLLRLSVGADGKFIVDDHATGRVYA